MKNSYTLSRLLAVVVLLVIIVSVLASCKIDDNNSTQYKIEKIQDQYYLLIETNGSDNSSGFNSVAAEIQFDSVKEFVEAVKNGKFNDEQIDIMKRTFPKDENGIKMCDVTNIKVPVYPKEFKCKTVFWGGERYSFYLESSKSPKAYLYYYSEENYNSHYEADFLKFFDREEIRIISSREEGNINEYVYSTDAGTMKKIRYTVDHEQTRFIVDETYRIDMVDESKATSEEVPYRVTIYGTTTNNEYFVVEIYDIKSKPTSEWIKCFGIENYAK